MIVGALDIGGTRTKLGLVSKDGRVVEREAVSTPKDGDPHALVQAVTTKLVPMLAKTVRAAVGVSVAGFLDRERATMFGNSNLPALCGFPLRHELDNALQRECVLEVDSNAAVLAEHRYGAVQDSRRLLGVTVGTGLGGGVIIDGALLRYTGECAGDVGHIIIADGGRRCTCGSRGCFEAMVCSAALSERAGGRTVRDVARAAAGGEPHALNAIKETARWLGIGLASLAPLFSPDTIVVGGGVAAAGDLLLDPVRESFRSHAAHDARDRVRIVGSTFEGWSGLVGAACNVFDRPR